MSVPVWTIDAFTAVPFRGNPAAVCWLESPRDPAWRQSVAAETNPSETAFVEPEHDGFGLRFFAPGHGIDEDPVTGGAHCMLGPYWHERLGRDRFVALQLSSRTGVLRLQLSGARIGIAGEAVTVAEGRILA